MALKYEGREYEAVEGMPRLAVEVAKPRSVEKAKEPMAYGVIAVDGKMAVGVRYNGSWSFLYSDRYDGLGISRLCAFAEKTCAINNTSEEMQSIRGRINDLSRFAGKKARKTSDKEWAERFRISRLMIDSLDKNRDFALRLSS